MQLRHSVPGLGARVVLTGAVIISGTLLASGCSSSGSSTPAAAPDSVSGTAPAASSGSSASAPSSSAVNPGATEAGTETCAQEAKHAFIQVAKVVSATDGGLTVTGSKATLVCGGPDDSHDTKIFLIGGSLSAISRLQEQFHP